MYKFSITRIFIILRYTIEIGPYLASLIMIIMSFEVILFYLILIDSISANIFAMFGERWYVHHFRHISRLFPLAKGWTLYYLVLVLWIGSLLYRSAGLF